MLSGGVGTLLRSLLWATLAVAVLGMHHIPGSGHTADTGHSVVHPADPAAEDCCLVQAAGPVSNESPAGHGARHDLLHLCLAILAAVTGLTMVLFAVTWRLPVDSAPAWRHRRSRGFGRGPPTPTLRRLAVLCVLRQ